MLAASPALLALDEPTRGLDYVTKRRLVSILKQLAAEGHGVLIATHDVELVAEVADRMVVLADGEIVSEGPARDVAVSSPVFAPQVAKVLAPLPLLTVGDVEARPDEGAMSAISAVQLRPRSALASFVATGCRRARVRLAIARLAAGRSERRDGARQRCAVAVHRTARAAACRRARRGQRARHRAKAVAVLGVLAGCGAALRPLSGGATGFSFVFFLLIPAGRVLGRNFGFVLGAVTLLASALLTGHVGRGCRSRCSAARGPGSARAACRLGADEPS